MLNCPPLVLTSLSVPHWYQLLSTFSFLIDASRLVPQKSDDLLLSQFSKPKQKRHRCRNPNKIDINTLTGEERVPVVNRRNGRKVRPGAPPARLRGGGTMSCSLARLRPQMGGAMAPPMKELPRWLLDNPEFSVAPDWTDIVKQSVSSV